MVPVELSFERDIEPVVRKHAGFVFRNSAESTELVDDAVSLAWEAFMAAQKRIAPSRFAFYAVRQVKGGRQFKQSERSITGPDLPRCKKPHRVESVEVEDIAAGPGDNPADVATVKVDFADWLLTLTEREQQFLVGCLCGESTSEMAAKFSVTLARVSQIRRELLEHYRVFTS